jgi:hypothetical protein
MLRFRVDPPTVRRPPYGLLDVAEVVEREDAHWRTGIEYDTFTCSQAKLWGRWCTGSGMPATLPDAVDITVTLTGALTTGTYSLTAAAAVEAPNAPRQMTFVYYEQGAPETVHTVTGAAAVTIASDDEPLNGHLVITDVLTGISINYNLVQNTDTGVLEHPASPIVFAVPQAAIPEGCEAIRTSITAVDADPGEGVGFTITTGGDATGERVVTIAGHQVTLAAGETDGALVIETGVGEGTWPISVRDIESGSFVSGWIYIDAALDGFAALIQATCPVKEIRSAPWSTLFAPAWTVYAEVECQSMAFDDAAAAASDVLELAAPKAIEAAWWDLAFDRARVIGTGLMVTEAIAELEHYIATNYNGLGLIHIPAYMAAWTGWMTGGAWITVGAEQNDGGELRTVRGTPIVIGAGYPRVANDTGVGPAIMATGAVRLYMSEVTAIETFDRRSNLRSAVAERTVAAADDCLQPAVVYVDVAGTP